MRTIGVTPGADYHVQVSARVPGSANGTGAYFLGADFNQLAPTTYDGLDAGTLGPEEIERLGRSLMDVESTVRSLQAQFGIGKSEYYREHQRALDAVISLLAEQWGYVGPIVRLPGGDGTGLGPGQRHPVQQHGEQRLE